MIVDSGEGGVFTFGVDDDDDVDVVLASDIGVDMLLTGLDVASPPMSTI